MNRVVIACLAFLAAPAAAAQSSEDYARMSSKAFSAWVCAAFASEAGQSTEHERLFMLGYKLGKRFLEATRNGKVSEEHFRSMVPVGFSWNMDGPSADFILGRVWEDAMQHAVREYTDQGKSLDAEVNKMVAENEFQQRNCAFLTE